LDEQAFALVHLEAREAPEKIHTQPVEVQPRSVRKSPENS